MVRRALEKIQEPVMLPTEEMAQKKIKLRLIDFDAEIAKLNLQSLESSRRILKDLDEMNADGVHTLAALEDQDEQLDKIEENLSRVNEDLNIVSESVRNMNKCCGCKIMRILCFPFNRFRKRERDIIKDEIMENLKTSSPPKEGSPVIFRNSSKRRESGGEFIKRLTCDAIEDELEKNMMQVDEHLESIKNLAVDLHVQLKIQEPKLDRIEELTETNDFVVEGVNDKVKKLLE
ncbi:unnamed protein product [Caenorhabditis bovis]|uniref:t-SNARE coiled-coil homology domain-containing protein n=1 Tax=Caenorhabditis bovis TaxID=2654633 RepID=A0A8S1EEZ6_9PELO|nr:unnamed protein product [Caenorhabditis bovis]